MYQQETAARGAVDGRFSGGPVESTGAALGNIGQGLEKIDQAVTYGQIAEARLLGQQQRASDDLSATADAAKADVYLRDQTEKMKGSARPGAFGYAGDVGKMIEDYVSKVGETEATDYYKQQFQRHMIPITTALLNHAKQYEATEMRGHRLSLVDSAIADGERLVAQDPGATERALGRIMSMLPPDSDNPFGVLPHDRDRVVEVARKRIVNAAVNGVILRNPIQANMILNDPNGDPSALLISDKNPERAGRSLWQMNGENVPVNLGTPEELSHWRALARAEANREGVNLRHGLDQTYADHIAMFKDGVAPAQLLTREQILAAYAKNPEQGQQLADTYEDAQRVSANVAAFRAMPSTELEKYLNKKPDATSTNYAREERLLRAQGEAAKLIIEQRSSDFIGWAFKNGIGNVKPINWADPQSIASEMKNRAALGQTAREWGNGYQVLSKAETDQLADYLKNIQPEDQARVLGQIKQAGGVQALRAVSEQLKSGHQDYAIGGYLSQFGTTQGTNVGRMFLEGIQAIAQDRAKIDKAQETGVRANIFNAIQGAYYTPQGQDTAARAAYGIYAWLKANGDDNVDRAVRLATGGLIDMNGQKVPKPYGWEDSRFRDAVAAARVTGDKFIANGHELTADQVNASIPGARLVSYGAGLYAIRSGQGFVMTGDGRPALLSIGGNGTDQEPTSAPSGVVMPKASLPTAKKRPF